MLPKNRKLNLQERIQLFKQQANWRQEVQAYENDGYTYEQAMVKAMDHNNIPSRGRTIIRDTTAVKVL